MKSPLGILCLVATAAIAVLPGCGKGDEDPKVKDQHEESEEEHGEPTAVRLSPDELKEFGIELRIAGPGVVRARLELPGEVMLNPDRLAHVAPLVPGRVREVRAGIGDQVHKGDVMAVIDSRELANLKADWLAARERVSLWRATYAREERLYKQKISSEQEYLNARTALAEARIQRRSSEQKLHALGFSNKDLKRLARNPEQPIARFDVVAPINGTVIEKHATLGEKLDSDTKAFIVADLSIVWVYLTVYQKDLAMVREGQTVEISSDQGVLKAEGRIDYVSPVVDESTRTARARVVLDNTDGAWKPGMFVTGRVAVGEVKAAVAIPVQAVMDMDDHEVVFVETPEGFKPRPVKKGLADGELVEIKAGLKAGDRFAATQAFTLKAQMQKSSFEDDEHGH
ncbi:MAG: efflux RND transporter periplasmic adaptor subunit [Deltaproteobacteria bacterium]|nr:efflux RND transporter periplasmic adaptor subunit [Deltaproteobacteria bacterium]